jgi:hypothetical protein
LSLSCSRPLGSSPGQWRPIYRDCWNWPERRRSRPSRPLPWWVPLKWPPDSSSLPSFAVSIRSFQPGWPRRCIRLVRPLGDSGRHRCRPVRRPLRRRQRAFDHRSRHRSARYIRATRLRERTGLIGAPARAAQALAPVTFGLLLDEVARDFPKSMSPCLRRSALFAAVDSGRIAYGVNAGKAQMAGRSCSLIAKNGGRGPAQEQARNRRVPQWLAASTNRLVIKQQIEPRLHISTMDGRNDKRMKT